MFFGKIENHNLELLKWIAIFGMFIDHFSKLMIPYTDYSPLLFEIGRISFPIFAFILVYNYLYNTSSKISYLKRLLIFSFISQPFFMIAFKTYNLNIFFVLFLGLLCIYLIEKGIEKNQVYVYTSAVIFINIVFGLFIDYKPIGIFVIISLYFVFTFKEYKYWFLFIISVVLANNYTYSLNNGLMGLFLGIILLHLTLYFVINKNKVVVPRVNKWIFYSFYPLHMVFILIIQYLVG